jgi:hypothetical protein
MANCAYYFGMFIFIITFPISIPISLLVDCRDKKREVESQNTQQAPQSQSNTPVLPIPSAPPAPRQSVSTQDSENPIPIEPPIEISVEIPVQNNKTNKHYKTNKNNKIQSSEEPINC